MCIVLCIILAFSQLPTPTEYICLVCSYKNSRTDVLSFVNSLLVWLKCQTSLHLAFDFFAVRIMQICKASHQKYAVYRIRNVVEKIYFNMMILILIFPLSWLPYFNFMVLLRASHISSEFSLMLFYSSCNELKKVIGVFCNETQLDFFSTQSYQEIRGNMLVTFISVEFRVQWMFHFVIYANKFVVAHTVLQKMKSVQFEGNEEVRRLRTYLLCSWRLLWLSASDRIPITYHKLQKWQSPLPPTSFSNNEIISTGVGWV